MRLREKLEKKTCSRVLTYDPEKHHPFRLELLNRGISQRQAAFYCEISVQLLNAYLVGKIKMPEGIEKQLSELVIQIDEEEGR